MVLSEQQLMVLSEQQLRWIDEIAPGHPHGKPSMTAQDKPLPQQMPSEEEIARALEKTDDIDWGVEDFGKLCEYIAQFVLGLLAHKRFSIGNPAHSEEVYDLKDSEIARDLHSPPSAAGGETGYMCHTYTFENNRKLADEFAAGAFKNFGLSPERLKEYAAVIAELLDNATDFARALPPQPQGEGK